jgi:iron(II)-dependent oxidoreductase
MHTGTEVHTEAPASPGWADIRLADAAGLTQALTALRQRRLQLWQVYASALPPGLAVRYLPEINPPLWELGHMAWFEEFWIARNPQRHRGPNANPDTARAAPRLPRADALYHSSHVAHTRRWHLDLPSPERTWALADHIRQQTLDLLPHMAEDDTGLYFARLVAAHEAMHLEAWVAMAQTLAIDLRSTGLALEPARSRQPARALSVPAQVFTSGHVGGGLAFDNELPPLACTLEAFDIDSAPVTWGRYLPFIEAGGYDEARWWSPEGWAWRQKHSNGRPRHVVQEAGVWQRAVFGHWAALDPDAPAVHLSAHEAQTWCRWAGRRLPTEAEWECAACTLGEAFEWGQVWEWTASPFAPYPGFEAHPYRDYSVPWFDGRPVLRGASLATWPGLRSPRYRNYVPAERNDVIAGFRSCAARPGDAAQPGEAADATPGAVTPAPQKRRTSAGRPSSGEPR